MFLRGPGPPKCLLKIVSKSLVPQGPSVFNKDSNLFLSLDLDYRVFYPVILIVSTYDFLRIYNRLRCWWNSFIMWFTSGMVPTEVYFFRLLHTVV